MKLLQLNFLPRSADFALLLLRVWLGLMLLLNHGWEKLTTFSAHVDRFADPLGVGRPLSLSLTVFAEVVCSLLLVLGLWTRLAALVLAIQMSVAFLLVHQRVLAGPGSGELAFIYLAGWAALFVAGGGRFALDRRLGAAS
jgi:putative oxidoreductase